MLFSISFQPKRYSDKGVTIACNKNETKWNSLLTYKHNGRSRQRAGDALSDYEITSGCSQR